MTEDGIASVGEGPVLGPVDGGSPSELDAMVAPRPAAMGEAAAVGTTPPDPRLELKKLPAVPQPYSL